MVLLALRERVAVTHVGLVTFLAMVLLQERTSVFVQVQIAMLRRHVWVVSGRSPQPDALDAFIVRNIPLMLHVALAVVAWQTLHRIWQLRSVDEGYLQLSIGTYHDTRTNVFP